MNRELHQRASEIFLEASQRAADERATFLTETCGGDDELRREVESLLDFDGREGDFLTASTEAAEQMTRPPHDTIDTPAKEIGGFRIVSVLGEGGMGVVYEAEQDQPRRRVALKVLRSGVASPSALRRFEYEVEVLGQLQHPGIAQIHAAGMAVTDRGSHPYFAMELVRGSTLGAWVDERRPSVRERLRLFASICEAVHHAHQKGVVHRDLKPSNILVDGDDQPRILDFGIARATQPGMVDPQTAMTGDGQLLGTLPYMSPEQVTGKPLDVRSDVYSLGVILFQMLSGMLPIDFTQVSVPQAVLIIAEREPAKLRTIKPRTPVDVETIVAKALEKDPDRRYQSASDLAADIGRFLGNEPIVARPASTLYQLRKFAARNKVIVGATASVLVALVIGIVTTGSALNLARDNLREMERFSDSLLIIDLMHEARELFPRRPNLVDRYETWLDRAREVESRRGQHEEFLARLLDSTLTEQIAAGIVAADASDPDWHSAGIQARWRYESLRQAVADMDDLSQRIRDVEERLVLATRLDHLTHVVHADDWEQARAAIRESEHYGGLDLPVQFGLVPLGADPESGFEEFWDVGTGERPERRADGIGWEIGEATGMVFVLLPGGTFEMGAREVSDELAPDGKDDDPDPAIRSRPVHSVTLDPFFLSKYEMTQGQWLVVGPIGNPSTFYPGEDTLTDQPFTLAHPVETVNWNMCSTKLRKLGFVLPTEAQWEYAARGGTDTKWWTGDEHSSLEGKENLADRVARERGGPPLWPYSDVLSDGWIGHAPVGTFAPNPFGLFDVHGNVAEWVRDFKSAYTVPVRPGDGERPKTDSESGLRRGGSYRQNLLSSRSSFRLTTSRPNRLITVGVRPARRIE